VLDLNQPISLSAKGLAAALLAAGYPRGMDYAAELARLCPMAGLTTPLRLTHFLAQCAIESDRFKTATEYASGIAYEGRKDLGNTEAGDGKRFKGRGLIQTTGRHNYKRLTDALRKGFGCFPADSAGPNFILSPALVATPAYAVVSALVYWHDTKLAAVSDEGDTARVCQKVSRGVNRGNPNSTKAANHEKERTDAFCAIMEQVRKMEGAL